VLSLKNISKSFDGNPALREVSVDVAAGRVLAICGENGAGKSTLMKILSGALRPDNGEIRINGEPIMFRDPREALDRGIQIVHQELSLLPHLSVTENIMMGRMPSRGPAWRIDWNEAEKTTANVLRKLGFSGIDVRARVAQLSVSLQQIVEIAKAVVDPPRILVLDEPTAVLSAHETNLLFRMIREQTAAGTAVLYISHRLEEIFDICDDILVLKDGAQILSAPARELDREALVRAMVGRSLATIYPERSPPRSNVVLDVRGLGRGTSFRDITFSIKAGEIVGMFGLVGSGRSEIARAIFGAEPATEGTIALEGRQVAIRTPDNAVKCGIALITEDRKRDGLALGCTVLDNASLASMERFSRAGILDKAQQRAEVRAKLDQLSIRPRDPQRIARQLSGGNQQKVVLGKWMLRDNLRLYIFDEPTRGVDIATKVEIYNMIAALAAAGHAILLISSEMPEVLGLSHRLLVIRAGTIAAMLEPEQFGMETVFTHAAGFDAGKAA
jgi:ABC-type sugar transport system ATPase subunit